MEITSSKYGATFKAADKIKLVLRELPVSEAIMALALVKNSYLGELEEMEEDYWVEVSNAPNT